ncbi:MAG: acyl-ACP thioesterase domain-containing protein [Christensenellales bacterium]
MNKTYTESFQVRATDCDFERRMRLDALFIAMQEGGEHHALSLGAGYDQMMARGLFFAWRASMSARSARRGRTKPLSTRHGRAK